MVDTAPSAGDFVPEFLAESYEALDKAVRVIRRFEGDPDSAMVWDLILCTMHSLKGMSGFLQYSNLESLAISGEVLVSRFRSKNIKLDPNIESILFELIDRIRQMLNAIESVGNEANEDCGELIDRIMEFREGFY